MAKLMNVTVSPYNCDKVNIGACSWTSDQVVYFTQRCKYFRNVLKPEIQWYTQTLLPPLISAIGLLCHPLTFITLRRPAFRTSTFLYLRIISVVEFMHVLMVIQWYYCKKSKLHKDTNYCRVYCNVVDWGPLSANKLFATTLSLFLAMERLTAVIFPKIFSKINNKKFVGLACFCSLIIVILPLTQMANDRYVWHFQNTSSPWWKLDSEGTEFFEERIYGRIISPAILVLIIFEAVAIVTINFGSGIGLWLRQKRMSRMVGYESAQKDLQQMKRLWQFQSIEAVVMFIDLLGQICMNLYEHDDIFNVNCDYDEQVYGMWSYEMNQWEGFFNDGAKYANHFTIFLLFVAFNKLFRHELKKMFEKLGEKVGIRKRSTKIGPTSMAFNTFGSTKQTDISARRSSFFVRTQL